MHATVLCNDNASTSPQSRRVSYTAPHPHCPNTLTTHLNKKCASVMIPCTQHHFLLPLPPNSISPACLPSRPPHTTFLVTCPYMVPVATRSSHHHGLFNLHAAAFTLAFTQQHLLGDRSTSWTYATNHLSMLFPQLPQSSLPFATSLHLQHVSLYYRYHCSIFYPPSQSAVQPLNSHLNHTESTITMLNQTLKFLQLVSLEHLSASRTSHTSSAEGYITCTW